ncbi:gamma-glutamylcyclotransferase (GGCT)/AIG2-like uncharacterized protein YtfP [Granulicella aggregans]|uniref:Gamma-glutamylcyclotransferase (GGCT)/AIG2-like uncharacterized protein YtfP n=1 Tax=Granulicella aggregans TaxID=474949 RepID=A0A7W8E4X5_9BACT|nr:gamma-glutamylcyclotransferase family protein [Granulicella aggregans]MBB5058699.1 gamma-glutamylcyclotransferase (GGCT)/AIG2-like uncharacterized protein YtfP [Granulicella aggregans]
MPDPLFIYGTLHPDRAPAAIAPTARLLKPFGGGRNGATIQARLYDLGAYPGVVLSDDPADTVSGELFILPENPAVLARLDDYEDFRTSDPAASLFLRQQTLATLQDSADAGTEIACWVYTYNRSIL